MCRIMTHQDDTWRIHSSLHLLEDCPSQLDIKYGEHGLGFEENTTHVI